MQIEEAEKEREDRRLESEEKGMGDFVRSKPEGRRSDLKGQWKTREILNFFCGWRERAVISTRLQPLPAIGRGQILRTKIITIYCGHLVHVAHDRSPAAGRPIAATIMIQCAGTRGRQEKTTHRCIGQLNRSWRHTEYQVAAPAVEFFLIVATHPYLEPHLLSSSACVVNSCRYSFPRYICGM